MKFVIWCKITTRLVEHASETLISRVLGLLFFLLLLGGLSSWGRLGGGGWAGGSVGVWVGNTVLQLVYLGPAVLGTNGDGQDLLVAVDNGVHDRWKGWEIGGQGDTGDGGDGAREGLEQLRLLNVENAGWEGVSIIVDLSNAHTVGEWRDVQHVEKGSLGSSDLGSSLDELQVGSDFDGTTGNLGWDTESLEERGLSGFHTSVTSWDVDIERSDGTGTGRSSDLVGENLVTDGLEVGVGEDETNVTLDEWQKTLVLGGVGEETLDGTTDLLKMKISFCARLVAIVTAERTMVFFPIKTTPSPRRDCLISCICWELTLSTPTMKIDLYSSRRAFSLSK